MCKRLFILFIVIFSSTQILADHRIGFFIKEYPEFHNGISEKKILKMEPRKAISKIQSASIMSNAVPGVFATYAGYGTFSNQDGLIIFPRKHQKPVVYLIVAPMIEPVIMLGKTVHHWIITHKKQSAMYKIERKQDPDTLLYFWDVTQERLPANNIIPLNSIVLIARTQDIFVPLGATLTNLSDQLILPDIYARRSLNVAANAARILNVNHFFELVRMLYRKGTNTTWMMQVHG